MKIQICDVKKRKFISGILVLLMIAFLLSTFRPQQANGSGLSSGTGEVILGKYIETEFLAEKTIDLSNSDINITFTESEKAKVDAEADESTLKWLYKMIAIEGAGNDIEAEDKVTKYKLYEKYWYDDLDISGLSLDDETKAIVDKIKSCGTVSSLLKLSDNELEELLEIADISDVRKTLEYKKVEIYNDKQSDVLVAKIVKNIPVEVKFAIEPIGEDEKSKYGVDDSKIKPGTLKSKNDSAKLSTVDFGNQDQLYDEVLANGMEKYFNATGEDQDSEMLGDGKDFITHTMLIDGAELVSSDDSQHSGGIKRGDPAYPGKHYLLEVGDPLAAYAWARYGVPGPGYVATFNLHLNPAVTYFTKAIKEDLITDITFDSNGRVLTVSKGIAKESDWENLIKSGAINTNVADGTYRYKIVESGISPSTIGNDRFYKNTATKILDVTISGGEVTGVEAFDDINMYKAKQGKINELQTKLNELDEQMKPLKEEISTINEKIDEAWKEYRDAGWTASAYQKYQAKLDEINTEKRPYLDQLEPLMKESNSITAALNKINGNSEYNTAEFTNPLDKEVKVEKTIEGGNDLKLETLEDSFTYRISTNLPKGASTFVIEDNLEKVLEFADPSKTTVKIADKALSTEEQAQVLTQSASQLKVTLDRTFLKQYGGNVITVDFSCKLKDGADLSPYEDKKVPNVAQVKIDDEFEVLSVGMTTATLPDEEITSDEDTDEDTPKATAKTTPKGGDKKTTNKRVRTAKTGDETMPGIMIAMLLAAVATYGLARRRG